MMTEEGSTKIKNFMTPGVGSFGVAFSMEHWSNKALKYKTKTQWVIFE